MQPRPPVAASLLLALALAVEPALAGTPPPGATALAIRGGGFHGSALVWSAPKGLVLTALHVVEEMPEIVVSIPGHGDRAARIVDRDPMLDLALLALDAPLPLEELPLGATVALERGDPVRLLGCPGGDCAAVLDGRVATRHRAYAGSRYLEIGASVAPGFSGGPVLDARGRVVGIVDLAVVAEGSTLSIPIEDAVRRFRRSR